MQVATALRIVSVVVAAKALLIGVVYLAARRNTWPPCAHRSG